MKTKLEELRAAYEAAMVDNVGFNDDPIMVFAYRAHNLMPQLLEAAEALGAIKASLSGNPLVHVGNSTVHYAYHKAVDAMEKLK